MSGSAAPGAARSSGRPGVRPVRAWSGLGSIRLAARLTFAAMILGVLVVAAASLVDAVPWIGKPFPGFLLNQRLAVGVIGQYHWTGPQAGLRFPDQVLAANGRPVRSIRELDGVVQAVPVGDPITYTIARGGAILEVPVPSMRFTLGDFLAIFGVYFLAGIVYLLIGLIVLVLKPDTRASWAFFTACCLLSVYYLTSFGLAGPHHGFVFVFLLGSTFVFAAGVHLSFVFPEPARWVGRRPALVYLPYGVAAAIFTALLATYPGPVFVGLYKLVLLCLVAALLALLTSALLAYLTSPSPLARQRAKVVLFGLALALPIPALAGVGSYFGVTLAGLQILNNFSALPVSIFPASIAYAIARHNLFDVDVYIKRAVGYALMTAIVGTAYFLMQTVLDRVLLAPLLGEHAGTVAPLLFALLIVFLFHPINRRTQELVEKVFFRKPFDYKATIRSVSNALTSLLDLDEILRQVIQTVRTEMFVDTAGVVVLEPDRGTQRAVFVGDGPRPDEARPLAVDDDDPLVSLAREQKTLITRYDLEEDPRFQDIRDPCLRSFTAMTASLAIPLVYQGQVSGLLALGYKKSGQFYTREDVELLTTMADQAAVAIKNATTHQEVVRYAAELEASLRRVQILESIKSNLAKFVPRTVTQLIEQSPEAPLLEKQEVDVSVLFADIRGYTRLSAQLELDQVNRLVERYFGTFLDEIVRYGGDVNETAGDGLMVIFRDPDPARHAWAAVMTGLAIRQRTEEINEQLRGQFEPITMHVGINSGIAAVGATRIEGAAGTRWTYTASGPTTNVAARFATLSEGGAVIISAETRRRIGDDFALDDLGPQALKNVPDPVRAYHVLAACPAALADRPRQERGL